MICQLSEEPALAKVVWELYGTGEQYPESFFKQYHNVDVRGEYRSLAQYREALSRLDAVVLLSTHNEGMPLSLIEAMASGVPWIATDRGGTRELLHSEACGGIIPKDATFSEICSCVRQFVEKISQNRTSRRVQRAAYEDCFAPCAIGDLWLSALVGGAPR